MSCEELTTLTVGLDLAFEFFFWQPETLDIFCFHSKTLGTNEFGLALLRNLYPAAAAGGFHQFSRIAP